MAQDTEKVVIQNEIKIISDAAEKKLKELEKLAKKFSDSLSPKKDNLNSRIASLENIAKGLKELQNAFSGRGLNGQFVSLGETIDLINQKSKALNATLRSMQNYTAGIGALSNKATISGQRTNLQYGTSLGLAYQEARNASTLEKMQREVNAYKLSLAGIDKETQKFAERTEKLNSYLGVTQLRLMANYAAINAVTSGFRYVLNYTGQFNAELKQLQAISAVSDTGLEGLKETIYDVANATKFTSLEVAQAATVLAQAGLSVSQIKETLPAIARLATATGTDLATSTDVITSTLNIYSLQVTEATQVTNSLTTAMNESKADIAGFQTAIQYAGNFAAQLGMSYEETAAAIAAATQAGIRSKSMLGTGLRAVLTEFLKPTDKLVTQLGKVGLTLNDIDVRGKGLTTVLKTLKDAGFGAAEAFRGMERRGAAFLVALINNVDFIGQLRQRMAGSTAAMQANETQMEALVNQWSNFKSIIGNVAYEGLEPMIELLSKLLKVINSFMSSGVVNLLGNVLFGTITTAGTAAFVAMILKSLGSIGTALVTLKTNLERMKTLASAGGVLGTINTAGGIASLSLSGIVKLSTGIGLLITLLGMAGSAMGLFTSEADKNKATLEEAIGSLDKAQQSYSAIQNVMSRLYANRQKLDDQAERNIFTREIASRFPEAIGLIKSANLSFEELEEVAKRVNNIKLDGLIEETRKVADAAKKNLGTTSVENLKNLFYGYGTNLANTRNEFIDSFNKDIITLASKLPSFDIVSFQKSIQKYAPSDRELLINPGGSKQAFAENISPELTREIVKAVKESFPDNTKAQIDTVTNLSNLVKDFKPILEGIANDLEAQDNVLSASFTKAIKTGFGDDISQSIKNIQASIDSSAEAQKDVNFSLRLGTDLTKEQVETVKDNNKNLEDLQKKLDSLKNIKSVSDLASFLGISESDVRNRFNAARIKNPSLKNASDEDFVSASVKILTSEFSDSAGRLIEAMTSLEDTIASSSKLDSASRGVAVETSRLINQRIAALGNVSADELAEEVQTIKGLISEYKDYARAAAGMGNLEEGTILNVEQAKAESRINMQMDLWNKKLTAAEEKVASTIDTIGIKMDYFFKMLKARIEEADAVYNRAIANMNKPINIQEGRVTAAERYYGSGSVIASVEQERLRRMEEATLSEELAASVRLYNRYDEILKQLRSNPLYENIREEYNRAKINYESIRNSGSATAIDSAYKQLNRTADTYNKFASQEADLEKSMQDLKTSINQNTSIQRSLASLQSLSGTAQIRGGIAYGAESYMNSVKNQGLTTLAETTASFTAQSIDTLDSSFSEMFSNILSGSAKAGDAFKSFGEQVISTLRDIAIQMAVKQGLNLFLQSMGFGGEEGPTNLLSQIKGGGKAQGGLVTGPIKNRDSVLTSLMPGEYVLKKSAVDTLGRDYLDNLNNNSSGVVQEATAKVDSALSVGNNNESSKGTGVVNVYVVGQNQQQAMTPNDVLVTISNDMLKGGQTKRLVKQIAMGSL